MSDTLRHLLDSLTPSQQEAVRHVDGPLLMLAGPGSGKTRVVTHRIAYLLAQGIPARQILALTFTNKAADEMRGRVEALAPGERVWISTFHRFCARLLREFAPLVGLRENYTIYDTSDSQQALRLAMHSLDVDSTHYTPQRVAAAISQAKNALLTPEKFVPRPGSPVGSVVAHVYPAYQQRLLSSSAVDFDDLLLHVATLLREHPEVRRSLDARYRYILVDEYQDTNLAQYAIVRALSLDYPNLSVTGDPDQSIYGWRGANLSNILEFETDYPSVRVVRLEQNYRSTKRILRAASELISHNLRRKQKGLFTDNDEGAPVRLSTYASQKSEAEAIAARIAAEVRAGRRRPRDFAIFYRVNALSRALEHALREEGAPYQMVNGVEFYQRKEIKDLLAYLTLLNNPRDDVALLRVINTPARGIGKTTIERLRDYAEHRRKTLLEAAREAGLIESLSKKAALGVARFVGLLDRLGEVALKPVEEIVGHVLSETGYAQALQKSEDEEDQERLANIQELLTAARQFDERHPGDGHLEVFLEESCLVNDTDAWEAADDRVTMMTLHASKGLEFPVVFVIALEEGLIPHERSQERDDLEEERRLLFVGMTRAREELHLSRATYRDFRGQRRMSVPSQFLLELPIDELEISSETLPTQVVSASSDWRLNDDAQGLDVYELPRFDSPPISPVTTTEPRRLQTAAEMVESRSDGMPRAGNNSPEAFAQSMLVRHPKYGLGRIVALSGTGARRTATVNFASGAGQRKFVLAQSELQLVKSSQ